MSNISNILMGIRIHRISGGFDCYGMKLKSLEGCPKIIKGDFDCYNNNLKTLKRKPKRSYGDFFCSDNSYKFTKEEVRALCDVGEDIYV